jgi:hypothetical protein
MNTNCLSNEKRSQILSPLYLVEFLARSSDLNNYKVIIRFWSDRTTHLVELYKILD